MRKYKLIKEYPGSPKVGLEVVESAKKYENGKLYEDPRTLGELGKYYNPEKWPEYWEEIKDEYPKIISFRMKGSQGIIYYLLSDGIFWHTPEITKSLGVSLESLMCSLYEIYQVATSETEIFTVGDRIKATDNFYWWDKEYIQYNSGRWTERFYNTTIKEFKIIPEGIVCIFNASNYGQLIQHVIKLSTPLFITEDGVDIYKGDMFFQLFDDNSYNFTTQYINDGRKFFKYLDNLKKYIERNTPRFSVKDIEEAMEYSKHKNNGKKCSIMSELKFKQKLGI